MVILSICKNKWPNIRISDNNIAIFTPIRPQVADKSKNMKGQFVANQDINVKYTYQLGGGLKGRTVKKGEIVTAIGVMNDINSQSVSCVELMHRIELNAFKALFTAI